MKKTILLKSVFLLCALVAGSSSVWAGVYELVTSPSQLVPGKKYLIVDRYKTKNMDNPSWYSLGVYSSTYYKTTSITASGDTDNANSLMITDVQSAHELTLGGSSSAWTLYDNTDSKYLALTKSANEIHRANNANANTAKWTISINSTSKLVTISNVGTTGRRIEGNQGSTRFACYKGAQGANETFLFVEVSAIISNAEYSTFCNATKALDFSTTGITVYTATDNKNSVTLNEVANGKIPANTPVVLYKSGANGSPISIPVITGTAPSAPAGTNDLHVSTGTDVEHMYVLAKNPTIGFYPWTGANLSAGKIYLQGKDSYGAREFLGFENGTTAINIVKTQQADGQYFNLAGQRVAQPTKGLYIVNGRKVVVK